VDERVDEMDSTSSTMTGTEEGMEERLEMGEVSRTGTTGGEGDRMSLSG